MAGCYSASDFLIPQPPHPARLLPKKAFVQDNEESINSGGHGRGGGEHWSLRLAQRRQQRGGLQGPAASQLFHTGPERTVGPSLTTAFDRQQAEPPRRRVSSPCFVHSVFGFGCQYITVFIYSPSLPHPLVIPSPGHYSLNTHALSTKCPGQGWGTQRADLGWPWRSTQQRAVAQRGQSGALTLVFQAGNLHPPLFPQQVLCR